MDLFLRHRFLGSGTSWWKVSCLHLATLIWWAGWAGSRGIWTFCGVNSWSLATELHQIKVPRFLGDSSCTVFTMKSLNYTYIIPYHFIRVATFTSSRFLLTFIFPLLEKPFAFRIQWIWCQWLVVWNNTDWWRRLAGRLINRSVTWPRWIPIPSVLKETNFWQSFLQACSQPCSSSQLAMRHLGKVRSEISDWSRPLYAFVPYLGLWTGKRHTMSGLLFKSVQLWSLHHRQLCHVHSAKCRRVHGSARRNCYTESALL